MLPSIPARALDAQQTVSPQVVRLLHWSYPPVARLEDTRAALVNMGLQYQLVYFGEVLGNAFGGVRQGAIYEGRLGFVVDADLAKILGWSGATFHASIHQIHGDGLSGHNLDNLLVVSG